RVAEAEQRMDMLGPERERGPIGGLGIGILLEAAIGVAKVVVVAGDIGFERNGAPETRDRILAAAQRRQRQTPVGMRVGKIRREPRRLVGGAQRLLELFRLAQRQAEIAMILGLLRVGFDGPADEPDGVLVSAALIRDDA